MRCLSTAQISAVVSVPLLLATGVLAYRPPQAECDGARIMAWTKYSSCAAKAIAKFTRDSPIDYDAASARCRHKYFGEWAKFQTNPKVAGSTCVGSRFTDNGDQTVTDNLTGLVWEEKDDSGGVHDRNNVYAWSTGEPFLPDGDVYTDFVRPLNDSGFAGASSWRLPSIVELQTILLDFPCTGKFASPSCTCPSILCFDPGLGPIGQVYQYWSSQYWVGPRLTWVITGQGSIGGVGGNLDAATARAVRDGPWRPSM